MDSWMLQMLSFQFGVISGFLILAFFSTFVIHLLINRQYRHHGWNSTCNTLFWLSRISTIASLILITLMFVFELNLVNLGLALIMAGFYRAFFGQVARLR